MPLVHLAPKDKEETQDRLDHQDLLDSQVQLAPPGFQEAQEIRVPQGMQVQKVILDLPVLQAPKETLEVQDLLDLLDHLEVQDPKDQKGRQVMQGQVVLQAR